MNQPEVEVVARELAYDGYFKIVRYGLRYARFAGGMSPIIQREVFERGHAVAVLPYDPVRDEVVLIEQFRPGAMGVVADPWLMETVAGIMEPGEEVIDVAHREAQEEAGVDLHDLVPVARYFASPGGSTETVQLFLGRIDATSAGGFFGLASEHEDIKVHVLPCDQVMVWLEKGSFRVATTIIALQWLALHRSQVKGKASWHDLHRSAEPEDAPFRLS